MKLNAKIVRSLVADILDRKGLGNEWDAMDAEIQDEIKEDWEEIINKHLQELAERMGEEWRDSDAES